MAFSTGLTEIVLVVEDVERAARFYGEVVGLTPETGPEDGWAWFWAGEPGKTQRVALRKGPLLFEERSPLPEGKRWGKIHFALDVPREDLEEAVEHVREEGTEVYGPVYLSWMEALSFYFYDPDGNLLEFWSPDPTSSNANPAEEDYP